MNCCDAIVVDWMEIFRVNIASHMVLLLARE